MESPEPITALLEVRRNLLGIEGTAIFTAQINLKDPRSVSITPLVRFSSRGVFHTNILSSGFIARGKL